MAWNPSPEVAAARDYAKRFGNKQVVILFITDNDQIGYASYGETRKLCDHAKQIAETAFQSVHDALENGDL